MTNANTRPNQGEWFRYALHDPYWRTMGHVFAASFYLGVPFGIWMLTLAIRGVVGLGTPGVRAIVLIGSVAAILGSFMAASGLWMTVSDIAVEAEGVRLYLLRSWSVLIPRRSFKHMKIQSVKTIPALDSAVTRREAFAIHVPGLPLYFKFTGSLYRLGFTSVFVITPDHEQYQLLIERLKEMQATSS